MKMSKVLSVAWLGLVRNKLRSLLTMLGVIIGVAAVIVMVSISAGTEAAIAEEINALGSNLLFVSGGLARGGPGGVDTSQALVYEDMFVIEERVNGITAISAEISSSQDVKSEDLTFTEVSIVGTTSDFPSVRDYEVADGRFFNQQELDRKSKVVVLGASIAAELFGDENPIGQTLTIDTTRVAVIGVMEERGTVGNVDFDSRIYIPITLSFQKFNVNRFAAISGNIINFIYVQVDPEKQIEDVIFQLELFLSEYKDVSLDDLPYNITTQQDIITTQEATTSAFRSLLAWVAGVSLIVGGIGIMNIMLVSVTERTREIGIRQSVGATPNDIRLQFLTEGLILSLIGGLIGILLGITGAWLFGIFGGMRTVIVGNSILLAFLSAAAVGIFFGYYPANAAAQLDPIQALRHE